MIKIETDINKLHKVSEEVTEKDSNIVFQSIVADMVNIVLSRRAQGLAANQIGAYKRIVACNFKRGLRVIVNPVIYDRSEITRKSPEGCMSLPGKFVTVDRPFSLKVKGLNRYMEEVDLEVEGSDAAIVEHEVDHLDGILITDKVDI